MQKNPDGYTNKAPEKPYVRAEFTQVRFYAV